jgi:hypothetical protein
MRETGEELIRFFVCILYTSRGFLLYTIAAGRDVQSGRLSGATLFPTVFHRGGKQEVRGAAPAWPGPAE